MFLNVASSGNDHCVNTRFHGIRGCGKRCPASVNDGRGGPVSAARVYISSACFGNCAFLQHRPVTILAQEACRMPLLLACMPATAGTASHTGIASTAAANCWSNSSCHPPLLQKTQCYKMRFPIACQQHLHKCQQTMDAGSCYAVCSVAVAATVAVLPVAVAILYHCKPCSAHGSTHLVVAAPFQGTLSLITISTLMFQAC